MDFLLNSVLVLKGCININVAFIIWVVVALVFNIIGFVCLNSKKPAGFWSNSNDKLEVVDVKGYNRAMCIMWNIFGICLIILGLPLLAGQNNALVILTIFGTVILIIVLMVAYVFIIEKKYKVVK